MTVPATGTGGAKTIRSKVASKAPRSAGARPTERPARAAFSEPADDPGPVQGTPARQRALRRQGRRTMRKLLDAAMEAFSSRGYHATRVNDIVDLARTSHGTFYLYFSNKEDILRALVSEALDEPGEYDPPLAAAEGTITWESIRDWVGHFSARWTRAAPLFRAWTELVNSDRELAARARQTLGTLSESLGHLVAGSGGAHDVDPGVAGAALFAMVDRFHGLRRNVGQPVTERDLDDLTTIVHRAFFQTPSGDGVTRPARPRPATAPSARAAGRARP